MQANFKQMRIDAGLTVADILKSYPDKRYDAPLYSKIESGLVNPPEPLKSHILRLCGINEEMPVQAGNEAEKRLASPDRYNSVRARWDAWETANITTNKERVMALMQDGKARTARQISMALKLPITSSRPRITQLCEEGQLVEVDRVSEAGSKSRVTRWRAAKWQTH